MARRSVITATRGELVRQAFVLDGESLSKLDAKIKQYVGSPHFEADCNDGIVRKFPDVQKLEDYENPPNKAIKKLKIVSIDILRERTIILTLQNNSYVPIYLHLDMPEEPHARLYNSITEILFSIKPWYSRLATLSIKVVFWQLLALLFILRSIYVFLKFPSFSLEEFGQQLSQLSMNEILQFIFLPILAVTIFYIFLATVIFPLLERGWKYLFPTSMFNVGQGVKRFENGEFLRKGVLISLLISIIASAIVVVGQLALIP